MIEAFQNINKAFESKVRLGNLASHTRALEELGYIECSKGFVGRKPRTVFRATKQGREAFKSHIEALENFLKST